MEAFFLFYWLPFVFFYPFLKMYNELHDYFSLKSKKTERELSHKYIFLILFFLTWIYSLLTSIHFKLFYSCKGCMFSMKLSTLYWYHWALFVLCSKDVLPLKHTSHSPHFKELLLMIPREKKGSLTFTHGLGLPLPVCHAVSSCNHPLWRDDSPTANMLLPSFQRHLKCKDLK